MLFSQPAFLFYFLPLLLLGYVLCPRPAQNALLTAASLVFYAWGEKAYSVLMLVSIGFNYLVTVRLDRSEDPPSRKKWLALGVACNLVLLGTFKYAGFFTQNVNQALSFFSLGSLPTVQLHLPIGISFFTFHAISYLVDVYRRTVPLARRLSDVALYISLFPQLVAGPIIRYKDVAMQIQQRSVTRTLFASGVQRFIIGFIKKILVADTVARPADQIFALPSGDLSPGVAWLGVLCYTVQIYFDFSGYSDMAIGLGRIFGFRFRENFNHPYVSKSLKEFWTRWHISLSTWYRDYLYIPLGGNRNGPWSTARNLCLVFFLCGLWHGASWSFVVWGLLHGVFLCLERASLYQKGLSLLGPVAHVYTMLLVIIGWVFFRAETIPQALHFLMNMFGLASGNVVGAGVLRFMTPELVGILVVGIVGSAPVVRGGRLLLEPRLTGAAGIAAWRLVNVCLLSAVFVVAAARMASGAYSPFLYFRF